MSINNLNIIFSNLSIEDYKITVYHENNNLFKFITRSKIYYVSYNCLKYIYFFNDIFDENSIGNSFSITCPKIPNFDQSIYNLITYCSSIDNNKNLDNMINEIPENVLIDTLNICNFLNCDIMLINICKIIFSKGVYNDNLNHYKIYYDYVEFENISKKFNKLNIESIYT